MSSGGQNTLTNNDDSVSLDLSELTKLLKEMHDSGALEDAPFPDEADPDDPENPFSVSMLHLILSDSFRARCPKDLFMDFVTVLIDRGVQVSDMDDLLDGMTLFVCQRTDMVPSVELGNAILYVLNQMNEDDSYTITNRPWHGGLRTMITRVIRTREVPFNLQRAMLAIATTAGQLLSGSFFDADPTFTFMLAQMACVTLRLQLEGLTDKETISEDGASVFLLESIFDMAENGFFSDELALSIANTIREVLTVCSMHIEGGNACESDKHVLLSLIAKIFSSGGWQLLDADRLDSLAQFLLSDAQQSDAASVALIRCVGAFPAAYTCPILLVAGAFILREYPEDHWQEAVAMTLDAFGELRDRPIDTVVAQEFARLVEVLPSEERENLVRAIARIVQ